MFVMRNLWIVCRYSSHGWREANRTNYVENLVLELEAGGPCEADRKPFKTSRVQAHSAV